MHFLKLSYSNTQFYLQTSHRLYLPLQALLPVPCSRRASTPFGWYSFYRPTVGRRLNRPGWLFTYRNKVTPRESNPDTVTHPSTNRAGRTLTSLIKTNALLLRQTAVYTTWCLHKPQYSFHCTFLTECLHGDTFPETHASQYVCVWVCFCLCVIIVFFTDCRIHLFSSLAARLFNKLTRYSLLVSTKSRNSRSQRPA